MGKRKGGKSQRGDKKPRTNTWRQDTEGGEGQQRGGWKALVLDSEKFATYYKAQGLVPPEEWDEFVAILKVPLPVTFRITGTMFADEIRKKLSSEFKSEAVQELTLDDGTKIEMPHPIPWYPGDNAWQMNVTKKDLKKLPALDKLHKFLMFQTDEGNASRQEAVSMLPPLLADIEPQHSVLDMCAAPGSKTSQVIEFLHAKDSDLRNPPTGFVVANDLDLNRCYLLTHQIKRLDSPNVLVTNHEAQNFPFIKVPPELVSDGGLEGVARDGRLLFVFDRIICDVPCSGDGTLRKAPDLWQRWSPGLGLGLHRLQCKIAVRGANLLKVGGRMVYSTCSLNPIENEAVVAELLRFGKGSLRLVDMSAALPALKRRPGLSSWKVQDHRGAWYNEYSDIQHASIRSKIAPTCFPPTDAERPELHLERCLRLLPHDQNTGGFFIAVLEKVAPLSPAAVSAQTAAPASTPAAAADAAPGKSEAASAASDGADADADADVGSDGATGEPVVDKETASAMLELPRDVAGKPALKRRGGEEPFLPIAAHMLHVVDKIRTFYGLSAEFPADRLMIRSENKDKLSMKTYYVADTLRRYVLSDDRDMLRTVSLGVKVLHRHEAKGVSCDYRLCQEGIRWLLPYMNKRVIAVTEADITTLLTNHDPMVSVFSDNARKLLAELHFEQGCITFVLTDSGHRFDGMVLVGWRGKQSCHLLVAKNEQTSLRDLFGIPQPDLPAKGTQKHGQPSPASADTASVDPVADDAVPTDVAAAADAVPQQTS
eukprot:TRINITY_DN30728_c0_g1_i1.p1 TRINITY_DN30728_c0_g1~~TRINITY_DN30728_c0_g1_i1.p1  ORF type:complete len:768 (-),score=228.60 TRINITY_DN30728_c0_g1_i1:186-2489(-)